MQEHWLSGRFFVQIAGKIIIIIYTIILPTQSIKILSSPTEFESKKVKLTSGSELSTYALKTLYNMLRYDTTHSFITADRLINLKACILIITNIFIHWLKL